MTLFKKKNEEGFTLIEMIIYIAILGLVITSFTSFVYSVTRTRSKAVAIEEVSSNGRVALNIIKQSMRSSDDVVTPTEGNVDTSLTLDMPGTVDNSLYSVSGGILYETIGANPSVAVTTNDVIVSNLQFTNVTKPGKKENIQVSFTVTYANPLAVGFSYTKNFQTSISQRK